MDTLGRKKLICFLKTQSFAEARIRSAPILNMAQEVFQLAQAGRPDIALQYWDNSLRQIDFKRNQFEKYPVLLDKLSSPVLTAVKQNIVYVQDNEAHESGEHFAQMLSQSTLSFVCDGGAYESEKPLVIGQDHDVSDAGSVLNTFWPSSRLAMGIPTPSITISIFSIAHKDRGMRGKFERLNSLGILSYISAGFLKITR